MDTELINLITSNLDRLYRYAYKRTRDSYKAEDMTQDIILCACKAYPKLQDKSKSLPWLWGIARNVYWQSLSPVKEVLTDEITIIDKAGISYEMPEIEHLKKIDIQNVRRAVSYLAKNYRDVCVMFWLEEKDYNTIANELQVPLSSVKWRLNQSKKQLREEFIKMDTMVNGYHKAIPLKFNMGGCVNKLDPKLGSYDNADKALDGLLPQNICIVAYESPKTVSEIASDLSVAADYVEESLKKLVDTQSVRQFGNKYQTMFPIWDKAINEDVFDGNMEYAIAESKEIIDTLYSLSGKIRNTGFYNCEKDFDKLILFLVGYICHNTQHNEFETDKLPFKGVDKAWYILASKEKGFSSRFFDGNGINSTGSMFGLREFYFYQKFIQDNRYERVHLQKAFYNIYLGEPVTDDYSLARVIESGKVVKDGSEYRITVPVISKERGDVDRLSEALSPVFEKTNKLQQKVYIRSLETVKKYIPKHIEHQTNFFGGYCSHSILETALFEELMNHNIEITKDMVTWFTVK